MSFSYAHLQRPKEISFGARVVARIASCWVYGLLAILFSSNILLGIAIYKSPTIANAISEKSSRQITAYENRIAYLRTELDRLHSRQHARSGDLNLQIQELATRLETLTEQHDYIHSLAAKARALGLDYDSKNTDISFSTTTSRPGKNASLAGISDKLHSMQGDSLAVMQAIADSARSSASKIEGELARAGITANRTTNGVGGPYAAPRADAEIPSHIEAANTAMRALQSFHEAREQLKRAPVFRPVANKFEYSSQFGNRRDPFTGKQAFHSGLDFRAPYGTSVRAVGDGTVIFTGRQGGYGNLVEVRHPGGWVSRYAHLSKISVQTGSPVSPRTVLGKVGSTGRSTGPHLHLEIRQNDKPLNPHLFIHTGQKLARFL